MGRIEPLWHTHTTLGGNATVNTGNTAVLGVMAAARIVGSLFSDQSGTLTISWSSDSTNFDAPDTTVSYTGGTKVYLNVEVRLPFCKVTYTNGATPQTTFRLYLYITDRTSNLTVT